MGQPALQVKQLQLQLLPADAFHPERGLFPERVGKYLNTGLFLKHIFRFNYYKLFTNGMESGLRFCPAAEIILNGRPVFDHCPGCQARFLSHPEFHKAGRFAVFLQFGKQLQAMKSEG